MWDFPPLRAMGTPGHHLFTWSTFTARSGFDQIPQTIKISMEPFNLSNLKDSHKSKRFYKNQFIAGDALQPPANRWEISTSCRAHGFGTLRVSTGKPTAALPSLEKAGSSLLKPEFNAVPASREHSALGWISLPCPINQTDNWFPASLPLSFLKPPWLCPKHLFSRSDFQPLPLQDCYLAGIHSHEQLSNSTTQLQHGSL